MHRASPEYKTPLQRPIIGEQISEIYQRQSSAAAFPVGATGLLDACNATYDVFVRRKVDSFIGGKIMFEFLHVQNPKRNSHAQSSWDVFFPYYAGFPETFAASILRSSRLPDNAIILDPWNGSGTTTYAASQLGYTSFGFDLNPAMVIVARARLLASSEADSLNPLAQEIVRRANAAIRKIQKRSS